MVRCCAVCGLPGDTDGEILMVQHQISVMDRLTDTVTMPVPRLSLCRPCGYRLYDEIPCCHCRATLQGRRSLTVSRQGWYHTDCVPQAAAFWKNHQPENVFAPYRGNEPPPTACCCYCGHASLENAHILIDSSGQFIHAACQRYFATHKNFCSVVTSFCFQ